MIKSEKCKKEKRKICKNLDHEKKDKCVQIKEKEEGKIRKN